MRRLARGYSIHLRSRAALIRRNDDFGIGMRRKTYPFGPFVRYEHFLRESCRRAEECWGLGLGVRSMYNLVA